MVKDLTSLSITRNSISLMRYVSLSSIKLNIFYDSDELSNNYTYHHHQASIFFIALFVNSLSCETKSHDIANFPQYTHNKAFPANLQIQTTSCKNMQIPILLYASQQRTFYCRERKAGNNITQSKHT